MCDELASMDDERARLKLGSAHRVQRRRPGRKAGPSSGPTGYVPAISDPKRLLGLGHEESLLVNNRLHPRDRISEKRY